MMKFNKHLLASAITFAVSGTSFSVMADDEHIEHTADETILITGNPYQRSTDEVMSSVSIIERVDIERIQPKSVAELLKTSAGSDIATNGGAGQATSVFVRGTNSTHTLFLVDGVRIDTVTGSGGSTVNQIPTYQIERVEIVRGPRAAMYGSDAVGAVVQIFTRNLHGGEYQASAEVGSDNFYSAGLTAGLDHGDGATTLSVSHENSDGYDVTDNAYGVDDDDDSYERLNFSLKGYQKLTEQLTLNWVGRLDDGEYDYDGNSAWTVLPPSQEYKSYLISTGLDYSVQNWKHEASLARYRERNERFGDWPAVDETRRDQLDYQSVYNHSDDLSVNFGGQFYQDEYNGDNSFSGESRDTKAVFVGALYQLDALLTEASVRYNDVDDTDSETTYNISLGYNLNTNLFISLNYGSGFKSPTLYQLYDSWSGNPDLVSETSQSWEFLVRSSLWDVHAEIAYFHMDFDDMLDYDFSTWRYGNISEAQIEGVELNLKKDIGALELSANYSYTDTEDKATGSQLSRRARHKGNVQASYSWDSLSVTGAWQYQGSRIDTYSNEDLKAYSTLDASINYQLNDNWQVQLKANNIFDEDYETAPGYVTPDRQYFLQVSYANF
jgi:vitamin B12 transporter